MAMSVHPFQVDICSSQRRRPPRHLHYPLAASLVWQGIGAK